MAMIESLNGLDEMTVLSDPQTKQTQLSIYEYADKTMPNYRPTL